ncbi:MAG: hypothetical protein ACLQHK_13810 [Gallionellaceae bacterium]
MRRQEVPCACDPAFDELKTRIMKGIEETNTSPVVFRWNKFDLGWFLK